MDFILTTVPTVIGITEFPGVLYRFPFSTLYALRSPLCTSP